MTLGEVWELRPEDGTFISRYAVVDEGGYIVATGVTPREALDRAEAADAVCGAAYGERSEARVNSRNGYRPRTVDTRVRSNGWSSRSLSQLLAAFGIAADTAAEMLIVADRTWCRPLRD